MRVPPIRRWHGNHGCRTAQGDLSRRVTNRARWFAVDPALFEILAEVNRDGVRRTCRWRKPHVSKCHPAEIDELALDEALTDGALLIEWPERLGARLWPETLKLTLARDGSGARALTADVPAAWGGRWPPR